MRKIGLLFVGFMLFLTSCSLEVSDMHSRVNNEEIAYNTFLKIVEAIENEDALILKEIFSKNIAIEDSQIDAFFNYIQGDVISYSDGKGVGVGVNSAVQYGKKSKEIQSSFWIETDQKKYYIAILECVIDEINTENVGVVSIYIIDSDMWQEEYIYGGDGAWTPGIHISKQ